MGGSASVYVALLRGINVGGKNRLAMGALCDSFRDVGCVHVESYIQSGNVVFRAAKADAGAIEKRIADAFGHDATKHCWMH